jgi:hypothetical protein
MLDIDAWIKPVCSECEQRPQGYIRIETSLMKSLFGSKIHTK